jgi:hypothetical protein
LLQKAALALLLLALLLCSIAMEIPREIHGDILFMEDVIN